MMIVQALLAWLPLFVTVTAQGACVAGRETPENPALVVSVQDENTLPVTKLSLSAIPPKTQFIAVVRERGPNPKKDLSDMQATLWEIRPDRVAAPAVRRVVFGRSHWTPSPSLDSPEVLRWQVPRKIHGYTVKLLGVNYATFEVTELLTAGYAHASGRWGDKLYFSTYDGQEVLDVKTGAVSKRDESMSVLASAGARKLDAVCRTADGNALLILNRGVFYLCNLETEALKQWAAPAELDKRGSIDLYAVDMSQD